MKRGLLRKGLLYCYIVILFCGSLLSTGCAVTRSYKIVEAKKEKEEKEMKIEPSQKKLRVGERITYSVEWMGLNVGIATLWIKEIIEMNGRQVYHIVATAETTPIISRLYRVEDKISTYVDVKEMYPVRFEKVQREGRHYKDDVVEFDQQNHKAYYFSRLKNEKRDYNIPERTQDPLSCIYFFRIQDIELKRPIFAHVHLDGKNWMLETNIIQKGTIRIKDTGKWDAFMAEPLTWFQGVLKKKAKVSIWFSNDEERLPLLVITSNIPVVGTITITLQKIEYLDT